MSEKTFAGGKDGHFLKIEPGLSFWEQPRLIRGIFGIILISTMMSAFELVFMYVVAYPQGKKLVDKLVEENQKTVEVGENDLPFTLPEFIGTPESIYENLARYSAAEEKRQREMNNLLAGASFILFILFLVAILRFLYVKLENESKHRHYVPIFGGEISVTVISSILAVVVLSTFQYFFYQFGTAYYYEGSEGDAELQLIFLNGLRSGFGFDEIE